MTKAERDELDAAVLSEVRYLTGLARAQATGWEHPLTFHVTFFRRGREGYPAVMARASSVDIRRSLSRLRDRRAVVGRHLPGSPIEWIVKA